MAADSRAEMPGGAGARSTPSRRQELRDPITFHFSISKPVVETILAVAPKLENDGVQAIASPCFGQRHGLARKRLFKSLESFDQRFSRRKYFRLPRYARSQLRRPRARMEVRFGFFAADPFDGSLNSYLPAQIGPMKNQRGPRIFREL